MVKVLAIVDDGGRILAAQFDLDKEKGDDETPSAALLTLPGQRQVEFDVPDEIEHLSGPDLTHFFSHVQTSWPAEVSIPRIEVIRRNHD